MKSFVTPFLILGLTGTVHAATIQLAPGYNFVGINVVNGSNTVRELFPEAPVGTLVFKWDRFLGYEAAQFLNSGWSNPTLTILPGEGSIIVASPVDTVDLQMIGEPPVEPRPFPVYAGMNLIASSTLAGLTPAEGDHVDRYQIAPFPRFTSFDYDFGEWFPAPPVLRPDEAVWYRTPQSLENPVGTPARLTPTIYFNNVAPALGVNAFAFMSWPCGWEGPGATAQLMGLSGSDYVPIGDPVPFGSGESAGFLLQTANLMRSITGAWSTFVVQLAYADRDPVSGEIVRVGSWRSESFQIDTDPLLPAGLGNLRFPFLLSSPILYQQPANVVVKSGDPATLVARFGIPGPGFSHVPEGSTFYGSPVRYRWQKLEASGLWSELEGASSDSLSIAQVLPSHEGSYRMHVRWGCLDSYSSTATIMIEPSVPPTELRLAIHHAVEIEFPTVLGLQYQLEVSGEDGVWTDSGPPITGTGDPVNRFHTTRAERHRWYRVRVVSP